MIKYASLLTMALVLVGGTVFAFETPVPATADTAVELPRAHSEIPLPVAEDLALVPMPTEDVVPLEAEGVVKGLWQHFTSHVKNEPTAWGLIGLVLSVFFLRGGYKGVVGALSTASDITSKGEVFGIGMSSVGIMTLALGVSRAAEWSAGPVSMIAGGALLALLGGGFACRAKAANDPAPSDSK